VVPAWARRLLAPFSLRPTPTGGTSYAIRAARILYRRAPSIAVFLVIVVLFDVVRSWSSDPVSLGGLADVILRAFPWTMAVVAVLAPVLAEATGARGVRLALLMTLLTFTLVGLAGLAIAALHPGVLARAVNESGSASNDALLFRGWWVYSVAGLLFAAYCQMREREQNVLRAARVAELARADAQREIVASRLKVLQARVEPEFLFDALADVRAAYLVDPAAADALLDDLVAYLRAALPQMRGGASTLGREAALAEAYLRVTPAARERRLAIHVAVPPDLADDDFPPMVLLPLAHGAVDAAASAVRIEASAAADTPDTTTRTLVVHATCPDVPASWSEDTLRVARETLHDYLGTTASLAVERVAGGIVALVAWDAAAKPGGEPAPAGIATPARPAQ